MEQEDMTMNKKEQKELERQQRQRERDRRIKLKKIKSLLPWLVAVLVIVGAVYWLTQWAKQKEAARPGESISIMGTEHISADAPVVTYNSNPPTSGPHAGPAPWGMSETVVPDINAIHNLEHGGIWITYKDLPAEEVEQLRQIADQNSQSVLVSPRENNDATIAVASWGRLMTLDTADSVKIQEFIDKNKNRSPEPLAR